MHFFLVIYLFILLVESQSCIFIKQNQTVYAGFVRVQVLWFGIAVVAKLVKLNQYPSMNFSISGVTLHFYAS